MFGLVWNQSLRSVAKVFRFLMIKESKDKHISNFETNN